MTSCRVGGENELLAWCGRNGLIKKRDKRAIVVSRKRDTSHDSPQIPSASSRRAPRRGRSARLRMTIKFCRVKV
jgi:hypothetical protein